MFSASNFRFMLFAGWLSLLLPPFAARSDDTRPSVPTVEATRTMRTSNMLGMPVRSPLGENLGKVEDLLFDLRSGTIAYAILSHGGFLGLGDKLFPIPWREMHLRFDENENYFVVDATAQFLRRLPSFDRKRWPDRDIGWQELVESLFPIHQGIVKSSGDGKLVLTFTDGGSERTHAVAQDAAITRNGKTVTLGDLQAGDRVKVTTVEQAGILAVTKIEAQSVIFNGYPLEETKSR